MELGASWGLNWDSPADFSTLLITWETPVFSYTHSNKPTQLRNKCRQNQFNYDKPCETGYESAMCNGKLRMWQVSWWIICFCSFRLSVNGFYHTIYHMLFW